MCGIAGISLKPGATLDQGMLDRMTAALAHRGPDGHGQYVLPTGALAHTRLAIIDLATGDQPLFDGPLALVANGETTALCMGTAEHWIAAGLDRDTSR